MNNPILGTLLHAVGGASASSCYLPYQKTQRWSWESFWIVQSFFAWLFVPALIGWLTVPDFFLILREAPTEALRNAFLLGAVYGFGGMSFGYAIRHIGYSLTYSISIGLSAVLGTITPLLLKGSLLSYFASTGSLIVLFGMVLSIVGVGLCGWAGFRKEKDLGATGANVANFKMTTGLLLAIAGGVLSAVFNISLEAGQPIADIAAQHGAGNFEGNAKLIVSTSGTFVINFIWFGIVGWRKGTLKELVPGSKTQATVSSENPRVFKNYSWSALAGTLWTAQFFFYGLGHVQMGKYQFISWVLHMSMLIFFSYIVGLIMKEWKAVTPVTYRILLSALVVLFLASVIISFGTTV